MAWTRGGALAMAGPFSLAVLAPLGPLVGPRGLPCWGLKLFCKEKKKGRDPCGHWPVSHPKTFAHAACTQPSCLARASFGVRVRVCSAPPTAHGQLLALSLLLTVSLTWLPVCSQVAVSTSGNDARYKSVLSCHFTSFPGAQCSRRITGSGGRQTCSIGFPAAQFTAGSVQAWAWPTWTSLSCSFSRFVVAVGLRSSFDLHSFFDLGGCVILAAVFGKSAACLSSAQGGT